MKNLRHLLRRVKPTKSRRASEVRSRGPLSNKRRLLSETLEQRQLLAADVGADPLAPVDDPVDDPSDVKEYAVAHNYWNRFDVNNDGQVTALDALRVINFMNEGSEGEPTSESVTYGGFVDVNADHQITALDALQVINYLNGGEGEETYDVLFELTPRNLDDSLLTTNGTYTTGSGATGVRYIADEGDVFKLEVAVQDNRGRNAFGVFQAVTDIVVNQSGVLEPAVGEIQGFNYDRSILSNAAPENRIQFFYGDDPSNVIEVGLDEFLGNDDVHVANFMKQTIVSLSQGAGNLNIAPEDLLVTAGTTSNSSPYQIRVEYNGLDLIGVDVPRLETVLTINGDVQPVQTIEENVRINGQFNPRTLVSRYETFMRNNPSNTSGGPGPKVYGLDRNIGSFATNVNGTDIFDEVGTLGPVGKISDFISPFSSSIAYDAFSIPVIAVKPAENVGVKLDKVQPREGFEGVLVYGTDNGKESVPLNKIGLTERSEFQLTVTGAATGITAADATLPTLAEDKTTPTTVQLSVTASSDETPVYAIPTPSTLGTASIDANGVFSFIPDANKFGTEVVQYTATTPTDGTATGHVTITVTAVNDPPVANDDAGGSVEVGSSILIDVLANDDAGGNNSEPISELTITVNESGLVAPTRGTVVVEGDKIRYTPTPGVASGSDQFSYRITDTGGLSATATVTLSVVNTQTGVSAGDKSIDILEDNGGEITSEVLVADFGGDDAGLITINTGSNTFTINSATAAGGRGTTRIDGLKVFYTPKQDDNGTVLITYNASNDAGGDNGVITVNIEAVNDKPVAPSLDFSINERSTQTINVLQPGSGQTPPSDVETPTANLIVSLVPGFNDPRGTVSVVDNQFVVTSTGTAAQGGFSFGYQVTDADGAVSDAGVVNINVVDVLDAPIAANSTRPAVDEAAQTITVNLTDLTTVEAGDSVTYSIVSQGEIGNATISGNNLVFTLGADENGTSQVVYRATGLNGSDTGTITFVVNPVNDAPTLGPIADQTVQEESFVDIDVLAAASDPDGDALTVTVVTEGSKGTTTIRPGGVVRYTASAGQLGADTIQVRVSDPSGEVSETRTININIQDVVLAPVASPGSLSAVEDGPNVTLDLRTLVNAQAGNVSFTITQPTGGKGSASVSGGILTYNPDADSNGQTTLTYTATNELGSSTNTITINITPTNDAPIAKDDDVVVIKNTAKQIDVLANDTPNPGGETDVITVTVAAGDGPSKGTITITDNVITYTPNAGATGSDSFVYTVSDDKGASDTAMVRITIKDFVPSSIGGQLYLDSITNLNQVILNGANPIRSGAYEPGETTLAGVRVHLTAVGNGSELEFTAVTNRDGRYSFDGIPPGQYEIRYNLPPGMQVAGEGVDGIIPVTIGAAGGQDVAADFTIESLGTLVNAGRNVVSSMPGTENLPASITPGEISSVFFIQDDNDVLVQNAVLVGRDFGDADYVELLVNQNRDQALLVVVNGSDVETAIVASDRFLLTELADGVEVKVFGGMNDFTFEDVDDISDITTTYPEYAAAIDELLGSL